MSGSNNEEVVEAHVLATSWYRTLVQDQRWAMPGDRAGAAARGSEARRKSEMKMRRTVGFRASMHIMPQEKKGVLSVSGPSWLKGQGDKMNSLLYFLVDPFTILQWEKVPLPFLIHFRCKSEFLYTWYVLVVDLEGGGKEGPVPLCTTRWQHC